MFGRVIVKCIHKNRLNILIPKCHSVAANSICNLPSACFASSLSGTHTTNITYKYKHAKAENPPLYENTSNLSERQFLVQIKNDPDTFGCTEAETEEIDPGDQAEQEFLEEKPVTSQKLRTKQYADIIKSFLQKRKIKEAIDVLEVRMIKEDRVKPENYIFNLIIGACGRVGYTKKAFSLYNNMKKRALKITPGTYTALFNACANSPWPTTDGLTRARHLRSIMIEKMYEPNYTNYNAMIKAFGRCGDLNTAFALVDEMSAKQFAIKDDTLNFLLQACITDKDAGFRHALLVWQKFIRKNITPTLYSYNLMLRCIRDCGLGDIETTKDVIDRLLGQNQQLVMLGESEQILIGSNKEAVDNKLIVIPSNDKIALVDTKNNNNQALISASNQTTMNKPNLMAKVPHLGNILSLSEVKKPEDRLLLVGGCSEFLQNMADNGCTPDVKTFTQLLDTIPSSLAAEKDLFQGLRKNNIKPDIDFFNMLIKKRSMRFDYESAKEVLTMLKTRRMRPNLITYGVLALGCKTKEEALSLLKEMCEVNYRINIEILGAMLTQACYHNSFPYVMQVMEMCITEEVRPSQRFLSCLEEFKKKCKSISNDSDNPLSKSTGFQKGYKIFKMRYKTWLEQVQVENAEEEHPWQQYRQASDTNVRHYKDKEAKTRFKPVHTSLYRQKTKVQKVKVKK